MSSQRQLHDSQPQICKSKSKHGRMVSLLIVVNLAERCGYGRIQVAGKFVYIFLSEHVQGVVDSWRILYILPYVHFKSIT